MKKVIIISILALFTLLSCDFSLQEWHDEKTKANVKIEYEEDLHDAYVGKKIVLNGSESTYGPNDEVIFSWELTSPEGSSAALKSVISNNKIIKSKKTFTPDIAGTYYVELNIKDDDNDQDSTIITLIVKDKPSKVPAEFMVKTIAPTSVSLSWNEVETATYYCLYRDSSISGSFTEQLFHGPDLQFNDEGLEPGKKYFYKVLAGNPVGETEKTAMIQAITPLTLPRNFQSSDNTLTTCDLSWSAAVNASRYLVEGSLSAEGGYYTMYDGSDLSTQITELESGAIYFFRIKAINDVTESVFSDLFRVNLSLNPPNQVENLYQTGGTQNSIILNWDTVQDVDGYKVYRATEQDATYSSISGIITENTFSDSDLEAGTVYSYKVSAIIRVHDDGTIKELEGAYSEPEECLTVPSEPSTISIENPTTSSLNISWNSVKGASSYKLFRSLSANGTYNEVDSESIKEQSSYTVTGLDDNTLYYFKVKAVNSTGSSEYSSYASGRTQLQPPAPPTDLAISEIEEDRVQLNWNDVSDATSYLIYLSQQSSTIPSQHNYSSTTNSISISGLNPGETYYVWVSSVKVETEGAKSSAKTFQMIPKRPSSVSVSIGSPGYSQVQISWEQVVGATKYMVKRSSSIYSVFSELQIVYNNTSFTDDSVDPNNRYYYKIVAGNDSGWGEESHYESLRTDPLPTYTINSMAYSGGSVSPTGNITVMHGSDKTFNFSPSYGYSISNVVVDGLSYGAKDSYTFLDVSSDHSISVAFEKNIYTINSSAGSGGSISPDGNINVTHGLNKTFYISPNSGYEISDVMVNNNSIGSKGSYTFNNVTEDQSIRAVFSLVSTDIQALSVSMTIESSWPRNTHPKTLGFSLKNAGPTALSSDNYQIDIYLSKNDTISTSDIKIGENYISSLTLGTGQSISLFSNSSGLSRS
jgi:fibronectin type 3 domain-containing protein